MLRNDADMEMIVKREEKEKESKLSSHHLSLPACFPLSSLPRSTKKEKVIKEKRSLTKRVKNESKKQRSQSK